MTAGRQLKRLSELDLDCILSFLCVFFLLLSVARFYDLKALS